MVVWENTRMVRAGASSTQVLCQCVRRANSTAAHLNRVQRVPTVIGGEGHQLGAGQQSVRTPSVSLGAIRVLPWSGSSTGLLGTLRSESIVWQMRLVSKVGARPLGGRLSRLTPLCIPLSTRSSLW